MVALLSVVLMISSAYAALPQFPITPYSNSTQVGYHVVNISTYGYFTAVIGSASFNVTQNFISPNESGATVNNVDYNLYVGRPVLIAGTNASYLMLVRINYIPRLHTVNFNIYSLQAQSTTSTIAASTTTIVTISSTTTISPTTIRPTVSIAPTTTVQPSTSGSLSNIIAQLVSFLRYIYSKL